MNYSLQDNLDAELVRGTAPHFHQTDLVLTQRRTAWRGKVPSACTVRNLSFHQSSQQSFFLIHSIPPCYDRIIPSIQLLLHTCSLNIRRAGNIPLAFYGPYLLIVVTLLSIPFRIYPEILSLNQSFLNTLCNKNPKADSYELLIFYSNLVLD